MSQSKHTTKREIREVLKNERAKNLWDPGWIRRELQECGPGAKRDVLEALLEYNEKQKNSKVYAPFDLEHEPISGASFAALANHAHDHMGGDFDVLHDTSDGRGRDSRLDTLSAEEKQTVVDKLEKADRFESRLPSRSAELRAEAEDLAGVDSYTNIDVDALSTLAEREQYGSDDDDGLDVDTLSREERIEEASQKAMKAKAMDSRIPNRAETLRTQASELIEGEDPDRLEEAGYDTLAELANPDYEAKAREYDDWENLKQRIDTLETKIPVMESRSSDRAEELKAERDALEKRAQEWS